MNIIFVVSPSEYLEDILAGFATDETGLRQLVCDRYCEYYYSQPEQLQIDVNLEAKKIVVRDLEDDDLTTYYIHTLKRVGT